MKQKPNQPGKDAMSQTKTQHLMNPSEFLGFMHWLALLAIPFFRVDYLELVARSLTPEVGLSLEFSGTFMTPKTCIK